MDRPRLPTITSRVGLLPDARVTVLEGEGHVFPQESRELTASNVAGFIDQHGR